ncbi:hypothetical protein KIPB_010686, partial [Kipferlia bialata]|eukprot:g10686.t1
MKILLLGVLLLFGLLLNGAAAYCPAELTERDALEAIWISTGGPYWQQGANWLVDPNICDW